MPIYLLFLFSLLVKKKEKKEQMLVNASCAFFSFLFLFFIPFRCCYLNGSLYIEVDGRWWKLQVGSKEQQTSHSQRFLIFISFFFFLWMVYTRGRCSSLSSSLALTYSDVS